MAASAALLEEKCLTSTLEAQLEALVLESASREARQAAALLEAKGLYARCVCV